VVLSTDVYRPWHGPCSHMWLIFVPFTDVDRPGKEHVVFAAHSVLSTDVTTVAGYEFHLFIGINAFGSRLL